MELNIKELKEEIWKLGVAAIKVPGINGGPVIIEARFAAILLDTVNREVWYKLEKEHLHIPLMTGWTMVPFEHLFGITFNDKPLSHEHYQEPIPPHSRNH